MRNHVRELLGVRDSFPTCLSAIVAATRDEQFHLRRQHLPLQRRYFRARQGYTASTSDDVILCT